MKNKNLIHFQGLKIDSSQLKTINGGSTFENTPSMGHHIPAKGQIIPAENEPIVDPKIKTPHGSETP